MGFRIEFLQLNMSKEGEAGNQMDTLVLGDQVVTDHSNYTTKQADKEQAEQDEQFIVAVVDKTSASKPPLRKESHLTAEHRKRSWVWKYFDKLSSIIYKCNICNVVLSIKGSNTNNMNRHVKTKHPMLYNAETSYMMKKKDGTQVQQLTDVACEVEIPTAKGEDTLVIRSVKAGTDEPQTPRSQRLSWIWNYFERTTRTHAQCKLCSRHISHGGNATGNMNRHLKSIHHDVFWRHNLEQKEDENSWIWKLFSTDEEEMFYNCKMCPFKCTKFINYKKTVRVILDHLKSNHDVISGDQIVTATECEAGEMDESTIAVDFLKDSEEI